MMTLKRFLAARPARVAVMLFVVASAARLMLIFNARFMGDETETWSVSRAIAQGKAFPLLGNVISMSSARLPGPILYYLLALPHLISSTPEFLNAFVALLGAASVVLFWSALRPYFGEMGAAVAGFLMACAPWSSLYADRLWGANVLQVFVALAFWAACRVRRKPALGPVVLLLVTAGAMPQLHLSCAVIWLALMPIFLPSLRRWRWSWVAIGVGLAAILYVPMLVSEHRSNFANLKLLLVPGPIDQLFKDDFFRVPLWAFRMLTLDVSYHQLHGYWGPHREKEMLTFLVRGNEDFSYGVLRWFLLGLSVLLAIFAIAVSLREAWGRRARGSRPFLWAAAFGLAANTALLGASHKVLYGHYVQCLLPFYFVAFAALGRYAVRHARLWWLVSGAAVLVCLGGIDAALWVNTHLDARNGIRTMRHVIAAIHQDQPTLARASISFGFRSGTSGYNVITSLDQSRQFSIADGYRMYALLALYTPPQPGARLVAVTGPVALYRLR